MLSQDAGMSLKIDRQKLTKQRSRKRKSFSVSLKRKNPADVLKLPPSQSELGPELSAKVSESFAWAFFTKKMKYTSELVYDDP